MGKHYEVYPYSEFKLMYAASKPKDIYALVTPVDYKYRKRVYGDFPDMSYMHAIAETAVVLSDNIGVGFNIRNNGFVGTEARIGKFVKVNFNTAITHDCDIKDYAYISMNVSMGGSVTVGEGTYVFEGSCLRPGINIGSYSVIGAGSVVTKDIPDNVMAYGNPCRIIKEINGVPNDDSDNYSDEYRFYYM
jgi:acetyltransferase-like isoleucine patch superfamily enzyme